MAFVSTWTDDRVETVEKLWNDGYSASQIAKTIGNVTRNAVIGIVFRRGLSKRAHAAPPTKFSRRTEPRRSPVKTPRLNPPRARMQPRGAVAATKLRPLGPPAPPVVIDASKAKPWTEREFGECAYPISGEMAETFSCCQPTDKTYCPGHAAVMFQPVQPTMKQTMRIGRMAA